MTDKNILKEVKRWQGLLSLHDWVFIIQPVKNSSLSDAGELAQCLISEASMSATIILATDLPEEEIKKSVRHEMLHVATNDVRSVFDDSCGLLGTEAGTALGNRYNKCEERLVIKLERLIDKLLPIEENWEEDE